MEVYHLLSNTFGSEETVRLRKNVLTVKDKILSTSLEDFILISSGSKSEGLDFSDSDLDIMMCYDDSKVSVFETENDARACTTTKMRIVMDVGNTRLPFTRLRLFGELPLEEILLDRFDTVEGSFITNKHAKNSFLNSCLDAFEVHGPCLSTMDKRLDLAPTLRCSTWLSFVRPWISRCRSNWPSNALIRTIIRYGVLFVPIGSKGSIYEDLEWRISFSVAEKLLINSFAHTQLLCYAVLKCILKDQIQQKHAELICSYFIKTILLWLAEEKKPSFWSPQNMICCIKTCLRRLMYCVEHNLCFHYFIPEVNFFECRFTNEEHAYLLFTLKEIIDLGWESIFYSDRVLYSNVQLSKQEVKYTSLLTKDVGKSVIFTENILAFLWKYGNFQNRKIFWSYLSYLMIQKVTKHSFIDYPKKNKAIYIEYSTAKPNLLLATCSNSMCAWSTLALMSYSEGNYLKSRNAVRHCLDLLQSIKGLREDIKASKITRPQWGYISHLIEPYNCDLLCFSCISDILPAEIRPPVSPRERERYLSGHKLIETFNKISKDKSYILNIMVGQNGLDSIHHINNFLHMHHFNQLSSKINEMDLELHALELLYCIDFLCSYHLNDLRGARNALENLENEINLSFASRFIQMEAIRMDITCLNKAKELNRELIHRNM